MAHRFKKLLAIELLILLPQRIDEVGMAQCLRDAMPVSKTQVLEPDCLD